MAEEKAKSKRLKKLHAVSKEAVDGNITHIVVSVDKDTGDISMCGSLGLVSGLQGDVNLHELLKENIQKSMSATENNRFCSTVTYPRLTFSPSSKKWKGSSLI